MKKQWKTAMVSLAVLAGVVSTDLMAHRMSAPSESDITLEETWDPNRLTCYEIRSYCYRMWMIRRRNYPQYVGCVLSNAENNGLSCRP